MIPPAIVSTLGMTSLVAAVSFGIGINMGAKYERATWEHRMTEIQAEQQQMILKHQEEIEAERLKQRQNEYKVEKEKESAIKQLKHDYERRAGSRLYVSADCPKATGQATTSSTSVVDAGTTTTILVPQQVTDDLYREAERGDTLVEQFRALQHYLIYLGLYKE
jgi:hypothetical protein